MSEHVANQDVQSQGSQQLTKYTLLDTTCTERRGKYAAHTQPLT